jgi:tetratricopeptide (TPR) repeat protein
METLMGLEILHRIMKHGTENDMKTADKLALIKSCERDIETALESLEMPEKLGDALESYRAARKTLEGLELAPADPAYREMQRVLAFCLLREANILRQTGRQKEAESVTEMEIAAARSSGDSVTLARSLMSYGATSIIAGERETGLRAIEEARGLFEKGGSFDHRQGLGWYWILKADLCNGGLLPGGAQAVIEAAGMALSILLPIKNYPGIARAHEARAKAYESMGDAKSAAEDRKSQKKYEKIKG